MSLDLSRLDPEQRAAVTAPDGLVIVWAGAGTGKTRTLTARFAWLVEQGIDPYRIMAVTFTRKAAEEMRRRITNLLGERIDAPLRLRIGTFHAQMAKDLRLRAAQELAAATGRTRSFTIYDEDDRERLLRRLLREKFGAPTPGQAPVPQDTDEPPNTEIDLSGGEAADQISRQKNEGRSPEHPETPPALRPLWRAYEDELRAADAFDFDDLLVVPRNLLRDDAFLRQRWSGSVDHLLVDELQDVNPVQIELMELLSSAHGNAFGVGDDAQGIFSFRGAQPEALLAFRRRHPEVQEFTLTRNYRSTTAILNLANAVLRYNPDNIQKTLVAHNPGSGSPTPSLHLVRDETAEAELIARSLAKAVAQGFPPGECAVLLRKNSQTRALESALAGAGLPYRLLGATAFWSRREVRDLVAWLRAIRSERDELAYLRALGAPARGVGEKLLSALRESVGAGASWPEALRAVAAGSAGTARGRAELARFDEQRTRWAQQLEFSRPEDLSADILEVSGLPESQGEGEEGDERRANLREVLAAAAPFGAGELEAFLETAALDDARIAPDPRGTVALATLHAAKGLEWSLVFLAGCEEGTLPHIRAETREELAEERRLFYVGVTRARRQLVLTAAIRRRVGGGWQTMRPSRFLREAGLSPQRPPAPAWSNR
jgi:DNA helicase-2/ATP-dependent DNA helicase PcrA